MIRNILLLSAAIFWSALSFAQTTVQLNINQMLGDEVFGYTKEGSNDLGNKFNVTRLQYYISNISLIHNGGEVTACEDVYILVNGNEDAKFILGAYEVDNIEAINFWIGVNAPENNDDPAKWPNGHALAPKFPSMHWGWSAGYRFVAIEGKSGDMLNRTYEVHALGNQNYFEVQIPVTAVDEAGTLMLNLNADYSNALSTINISNGVITHGDYAEAVTVLQNFANKVFTNADGEGNALGTNEYIYNSALKVYPNPSNGVVNLALDNFTEDNLNLEITDLSGRLVLQKQFNGQQTIELQKGVYLVSLLNNGELKALKKLIVQ